MYRLESDKISSIGSWLFELLTSLVMDQWSTSCTSPSPSPSLGFCCLELPPIWGKGFLPGFHTPIIFMLVALHDVILPQVVVCQEEFGSGNIYTKCCIIYLCQIMSLSVHCS